MTGPPEVVVEGCCFDLCLAEERVETLSSPRWRGSVLSGLEAEHSRFPLWRQLPGRWSQEAGVWWGVQGLPSAAE